MAKQATVKVLAPEVTEGMTIRGNLVPGAHVVTEIKIGQNQLRNRAATWTFLNAEGQKVWIGRFNAKAEIA